MILPLVLLSFSVFSNHVTAKKVCYEPYGCYTLDSPWWTIKRPFALLPKAPHEINTRFLLYTNNEPDELELVTNKTAALDFSDFDGNRPTKILIHGFLMNGFEKWIVNLKKELLRHEDCNVIVVQWGEGAGIPYMQATANARVVADEIAHLVRFLAREGHNHISKIHLIGNDVGAHIAGYVGKKTKIARISALDPSKPYFEGSDPTVRLDKGDADFIDVIHTDGSSLLLLGFGYDSPMGHVDFYPNGGSNQPGCGTLVDRLTGSFWDLLRIDLISAKEALACSHLRAIDLYIESINTKCPYVGFPCASEKDFTSGKCTKCTGDKKCSKLGYHSDKFEGRGTMYLTTNGRNPFCLTNYLTDVFTSSTQREATGHILVKFNGKSGRTDYFRVNGESLKIKRSQTFTSAVPVRINIGEILSIDVKYVDKSFLFRPDLEIDKVVIGTLTSDFGESNLIYFCVPKTKIGHEKSVNLKPSSKSC